MNFVKAVEQITGTDFKAAARDASIHVAAAPGAGIQTVKHLLRRKNLGPTEQFLESLDLRQSSGEFSCAAYLLADNNGKSIKIATYAGTDKVGLTETREYGHRRIIAATNRILDRLDSENRKFAKITSKRRLDKERVNIFALRKAVIIASCLLCVCKIADYGCASMSISVQLCRHCIGGEYRNGYFTGLKKANSGAARKRGHRLYSNKTAYA
jgi:hypothetical protein